MLQLSPIQQEIVTADKPKSILGLCTGFGKTLVSLSLAKGRTLIVVKKQQRVDKTFENTLLKFNIPLDVIVLTEDEFKKQANSLPKFDTIIIDEVHKMLGGTVAYFRFKTYFRPSGICKALMTYVKFHDIERVYLLSATIDASPMVVYNAAKIMGITYDLDKWIEAFYFLLNQRHKIKKDAGSNERLIKVVQKLGYYMKHQDAPEQIYRQIWVENTPEQNKRIEEIKIEYPDLQQVGKLYQLEQGVLKGNQFTPSETFPSLKYGIIRDIVKDNPRLIIFATYTEQIERIYETIKDIRPTFKLTGQTKKKDRETLLTDLEESSEYALIVNARIDAGWELSKCPTMAFFSLPFSSRSHSRIQAEGRIQRQNNLKVNTYIDIIAKGGVNEALYHSIKNGKKFSELIYYNQTK